MLSRTGRKCITLIEEIEFNPKVYLKKNMGFIKTCINMEIESNEQRRRSIAEAMSKD